MSAATRSVRCVLPFAAIAALFVASLFTTAMAQARDLTVPEADQARPLKAPDSFSSIKDEAERGTAMFEELGRVIQHPRCVNCHPRTERPLQGEAGELHEPLVVRGLGGIGAIGMFCTSCHGSENFRTVPGNPKWALAPDSMVWEGKSLGAICEQIKDPQRNGGKTLAELGEHMASDELVGYGWKAPAHLEPTPGDQQSFGELFHAWLAAGAHCPEP